MGLKIVDSITSIKSGILSALAQNISPDLKKKKPYIEKAVKQAIAEAIIQSPTIQSLSGGVLKADFGLTSDPASDIINAIVNSVNVEYTQLRSAGGRFTGGFRVSVQPISYANLYSLGVSQQAIEGGSLPWLKWLLEAGDSILIVDFGVEYGPYGRSGMGHMINSNRPFKVNSSFSGIAGDNFITRAIETHQTEINNAILKAVA